MEEVKQKGVPRMQPTLPGFEELVPKEASGTPRETEARRIAGLYLDPKTRESAKKLLREKKEESPDFVRAVIKETFNVLYQRTFPACPPLSHAEIEVATFNLSSDCDIDSFEKVGLLIRIGVIHDPPEEPGHTNKTLGSLPGQFLPKHYHRTIVVVDKDMPNSEIPAGYTGVTDKVIRDFKGIYRYAPDGTRLDLMYSTDDYKFLIADSEESTLSEEFKEKYVVAELTGKSETFDCMGGDLALIVDRRDIEGGKIKFVHIPTGFDPYKLPEHLAKEVDDLRRDRRNHIEDTDVAIYMVPGLTLLLPTATGHALVAGDNGAIVTETSTVSRDPGDVFLDERIIR